MIADLFSEQMTSQVQLAAGAYWLRGFALPQADMLCDILTQHFVDNPPQQMMTPMGYKMSVRTTSFGQFGWVGTERGYGYTKKNAFTKQPWLPIPDSFLDLAQQAALQGGYKDFIPDTCLVNVYEVGSKMGLHQDKDEQDFSQPIVSVSLGIPAIFLFGGAKRSDKTTKLTLTHGDVVVWGGASRWFYHGVNPIKPDQHPVLGKVRCNLTFRKVI
ncbi:MAG: DNA oxidative demethylase AlkB [Methylophilaceae bacterium]|nr:MAG: DNA oxidative demethylase AlkB [Methylophilaceae bacterium]